MTDIARVFSSKSFVGRVIRLPLRLLPKDKPVRVLSGPLRGYKWIVGAGIHGCWLGIYEKDKQGLYVEHIRAGQTVFDIGAHVGFYTLLSSRLVGPGGKVFAFEPSPRNLPFLKRHVELNKAANTKVLECAVADKPGEMGFDLPGVTLDADGYMGKISETGSVRVKVECIDGLLARGEITPAQLVKIDVEGAERMVLEGGRGFFTKHRPTIFLATHGAQVHKECCDLLVSWGYKLSPLGGGTLETTDEVLALPG